MGPHDSLWFTEISANSTQTVVLDIDPYLLVILCQAGAAAAPWWSLAQSGAAASMPYLVSPLSGNGRVESVLTFAASRR